MKQISILKSKHRPLFVFEHGLGDLINYLPVHNELCRQSGKKIMLATSAKRQFELIRPDIISLNGTESFGKYDYVYKVHYPDSSNSRPPIELHNESAKPYLCAYYEMGMEKFGWKPFRMNNKWTDPDSKRVGVHLFGHTGMQTKFCPNELHESIWNEIIEAGYEPFEVHMIPQFADDYKDDDKGCHDLPFVNKTNSLRFEEPDLKRMIEETGKCKFFVGIDSGPIYLATALIGPDRVIGLTNKKRHDHFYPKHICTANVGSYERGSIKRLIKQKEIWV